MQKAQTPLPVGTVIHEHYVIESLLGKGDFGNVYLVRDQRDKQKLFALAEVISPNERERYCFALEYVSLAPLNHRVLPRVQYVFTDDKLGRAYVLMSSIEEPNLELLRLQQVEKRFPLPQVTAIMTPVINAVTHLHRRRPPVIHRNIQPANIIVPRTVDAPVLVMLDIVKEHDPTTTTLTYFAPGYGAAEQYTGECNARTDIYGLGATCYTLLTGVAPPEALHRSTQLSNGEIDPLKPVNEVIPAIPTHIAEAIQRAMSIDADDRFSSAEQFLEALQSPERQLSPTISRSRPTSSLPLPAASKQPVEVPAPASVAKQSRTSRVWRPGTLLSIVRKQPVTKPAPAPVSKQPHAPRTPLQVLRAWKLGVVFIVIALLISLGISTDFSSRGQSLPAAHSATPVPTVMRSTPTSVPTSTPVSSIYPMLSGTYNGTIYDIPLNVRANLFLTDVHQSQGKISGYLTVGPGLLGYGLFSGTIDAAKHLQFTVTDTDGNPTLFFEGAMQSATSLSGDYYRCNPAQGSPCVRGPVGYGLWDVVLASSASGTIR